jgi:hypothetical protein
LGWIQEVPIEASTSIYFLQREAQASIVLLDAKRQYTYLIPSHELYAYDWSGGAFQIFSFLREFAETTLLKKACTRVNSEGSPSPATSRQLQKNSSKQQTGAQGLDTWINKNKAKNRAQAKGEDKCLRTGWTKQTRFERRAQKESRAAPWRLTKYIIIMHQQCSSISRLERLYTHAKAHHHDREIKKDLRDSTKLSHYATHFLGNAWTVLPPGTWEVEAPTVQHCQRSSYYVLSKHSTKKWILYLASSFSFS